MKQKLLDIKLILRIILSVLIIFSMLKSCAKAVTYQTIHDYANYTADYYPNNSIYQTIKSIINNMPSDKITLVNSVGTEFNNFVIYKHSTQNKYYIEFYHSNNNKLNSNGSQISITSGYYQIIQYNSGWGNFNSTNTNFSNRTISNGSSSSTSGKENQLTGMLYYEDEINGTLPPTFVGLQAMPPDITIYFGHMFSSTVTYNNEEMQANELSYNYRSDFIENVVTEDNEITSMQATLDNITLECNELGSYWDLVCSNSTLLKYNQVYTLNVTAIVNGNEEEIEEKVIFVPPGTTISGGVITNIPSGDYSFSTENATNQIIENQNQNQEENKGFFENLYNNMFTMNSGEVSGEINNLINSLNLTDSGERQIISMIYDEFNREPSDFVISWGAKSITIDGQTIPLIPSGEINFSEKCREEQSLARVKGLINVMVSASLIMAFIIGNHDMILKLLGTENTLLDDDRVEYIVTAEQVAQETLPPPNYPTWSGTDPNYWWHRARKR